VSKRERENRRVRVRENERGGKRKGEKTRKETTAR
jgi:hypothetical protein